MGLSYAHAASGARSPPPSSSAAHRGKILRRGRSESVHGSAVILLLVSAGGNVSFGNHGTLFGVSERVFYAERWAQRGRKVDAHFRRRGSELVLLSPRKRAGYTEKDRGSACAGCRGFPLPVSPNKVSSA